MRQFLSVTEFCAYYSNAGVTQKFIAPGHPATNSFAERNMQTLKRRLKYIPDGPVLERLQKILMFYRATHLASGKSPSELFLNHQIRLDAIFPAANQSFASNMSYTPKPCFRFQLAVERVQTPILDIWYFENVVQILGSHHYLVKVGRRRKLKRHISINSRRQVSV